MRAFAGNFPLIFFIFNLGTLGIVWVGGNMVISESLTLGELTAFMTYLNFMVFPMMMIGMRRANMTSLKVQKNSLKLTFSSLFGYFFFTEMT